MKHQRKLAALFAASPLMFLLAGGQSSRHVSYSDEIVPIFRAHCFSCHSGSQPAGGLSLDSAAGLLKGKVLVPGNPDSSSLYIRVIGKDGKPRMPMGFGALPGDQLELIKTWIADGAHIDGDGKGMHWAYIKPVRPTEPEVTQKSWIRNPIDSFVLARLEKEGLKPSPEASKETLIRRVTLDLTGIPPTPGEIDAFLADKRPNAYEKLVDRLLNSPHYGERQARPWLDLARYADSDGYEKDLNRSMYKYRDWVIEAFNQNLPYDQFTTQQIAGDLLPFKGTSQLVATGFNRNTMFNREGGVDQAEAHFNVVLDRVNTTSTVWLGSTLQCARCHDHKYDPFSQKDYYRMAAFYSNSLILPQGSKEAGDDAWFEPMLQLPSGKQVAEVTQMTRDLNAAKSAFDTKFANSKDLFHQWKQAAKAGASWSSLEASSAKSENGETLAPQADGSILVSGPAPKQDTYTVEGKATMTGVTALRVEALPHASMPDQGPGRGSNFVLTGLTLKVNGKEVPLIDVYTDYTQGGFDASRVLAHDSESGWSIYRRFGVPHTLVAQLGSPLSTESPADVQVILEQKSPFDKHVMGHFRLSFTSDAMPEAAVVPADVAKILGNPVQTPDEQIAVESRFKAVSTLLKPERLRIADLQKQLDTIQRGIPTAMVMKDLPAKGPLSTQVHNRGEFLSPTETVTANTPAVLGKMESNLPSNRLGLAEWITSKDNPLTARVEVNRIWEEYFGRGIVSTPEDFGTQGAHPSHPELLDWLATEFMRRNWDMKAMHRLIVTSATYRQSSDATADSLKKDPQDILMSRGPRFRMEAEMIRDNALMAAGILNLRVGGPSVYPTQPDGVWDTPANGDERWMPSKNGDDYRRGLYTFWKRTSPYPSFMTFDATSREECTVRRIRTNTPLQALAMLNDQAVFTASKALAKRMIHEGGADADKRIDLGFRLCTGRFPTATELKRLESLLGRLKVKFSADPAAAAKVGGTPAEAAYTLTANVLLNLDETLTKG